MHVTPFTHDYGEENSPDFAWWNTESAIYCDVLLFTALYGFFRRALCGCAKIAFRLSRTPRRRGLCRNISLQQIRAYRQHERDVVKGSGSGPFAGWHNCVSSQHIATRSLGVIQAQSQATCNLGHWHHAPNGPDHATKIIMHCRTVMPPPPIAHGHHRFESRRQTPFIMQAGAPRQAARANTYRQAGLKRLLTTCREHDAALHRKAIEIFANLQVERMAPRSP